MKSPALKPATKSLKIPATLHHALKVAAAQRGVNLGTYVEQLLQKGAK